MNSFLFEQYGYYPNLVKDTFFIEGWEFRLIEVEDDEETINQIESYIANVREKFSGKGAHIVKTRNGDKISFYDNKRFVLISVFKNNMEIADLNKLHLIGNEKDKSVDLKKLINYWQFRMEKIEQEGIASLRFDDAWYSSNLEIVMFVLGLCQNAIQYLSEIIEFYGNEINNVTIAHKRLKNLNSFDFFNPFNLIIDHPLRDFVELYKNNYIDITDLISIIEFYKFDDKLAALFIARLLYPSDVFDLLEENIEFKEKNFKINYSVEKEVNKIKKAYLYFKQKYNIRPISWLDTN